MKFVFRASSVILKINFTFFKNLFFPKNTKSHNLFRFYSKLTSLFNVKYSGTVFMLSCVFSQDQRIYTHIYVVKLSTLLVVKSIRKRYTRFTALLKLQFKYTYYTDSLIYTCIYIYIYIYIYIRRLMFLASLLLIVYSVLKLGYRTCVFLLSSKILLGLVFIF